MAAVITSEQLIPIDESFKVSAGPGAGKTHWLIGHIRNVIAHSKKLGVLKKVACITYTNVGADTIISRLDISNDAVEVCTIHSFLYSNVVKPYAYLVAREIGLKYEDMTVIDDSNFKTAGIATALLNQAKMTWVNQSAYLKGLKQAYWHYENHRHGDYKPKHPQSFPSGHGRKFVPNVCYIEFRRLLWRRGYISFDDILYISSLVLSSYPNLYGLIRARYPYVFVDEFQDTIPYVVDFLGELGKTDIVVGVVGDKAQTIYNFLGTSVQQFEDFNVPRMNEYEIRGNRRSTKQIIDLLNVIRLDFTQDWLNGIQGMKPVLMVGDMLDCYQKSIEICGSDDIQSLSYPNILANSMRMKNGTRTSDNILSLEFDSNSKRQMYIRCLLNAVEYAKMNDLRNAWHHLDVLSKDRAKTIIALRQLLNSYNDYKDGTLMDFYNTVINKLRLDLPRFKSGNTKEFYETHKYADAALCVNGVDSDDRHKTIHKSKGEEFENVFVILKEEHDLDFILAPDLYLENSHRVYYVAVSRAKQRLFINVPSLSLQNLSKIKKISVIDIELSSNI